MPAADPAMVIAVSAAFGRIGPMAAVGQTSGVLPPAAAEASLGGARRLRIGRTPAFGDVAVRGAKGGAPTALATTVCGLQA
jgi:hypothetical protein